MDVTGLTIEQILNMDWEDLNKLNRKDVAQITSRLVSTANKRIKRLAKAEYGKSSPAYISYEKRGRLFSVRGKDANQVRNELKNVSEFLKFKTSTIKGWKDTRTDVEKRIGKMTKKQAKKFWNTYRKLQEVSASKGGILSKEFSKRSARSSDRVQKMLYNTMKGKKGERWKVSQKDAIDTMLNKIEDAYQQEQRFDEDL